MIRKAEKEVRFLLNLLSVARETGSDQAIEVIAESAKMAILEGDGYSVTAANRLAQKINEEYYVRGNETAKDMSFVRSEIERIVKEVEAYAARARHMSDGDIVAYFRLCRDLNMGDAAIETGFQLL